MTGVIASVAFRNFKALRSASVMLEPFNLVIGPNGSGKTSLIQALLRLRTLARLPLREAGEDEERGVNAPEITFRFARPHDGLEAVVGCAAEAAGDVLQVTPLPRGEGVHDWPGLREELLGIRSYLFDHDAIARPARVGDAAELAGDGANLAAVLAAWRERAPVEFAALREEVLRVFTEYDDLDIAACAGAEGKVVLRLRLRDDEGWIEADSLSQGTLYALALLALAYDPKPPRLVCIEEVDRGVHPRLLREVRDALYRLSHPEARGLSRAPTQVIATTHSPYLLDLFRDHPEEVVIAEKRGREAFFARLSERPDVAELLGGGSLGDLWFSGILGGVPDER